VLKGSYQIKIFDWRIPLAGSLWCLFALRRKGQNVAVIILPAPEAFTTEKGLQSFGPGYVGLDQPYEPAVARLAEANS
jgi:hypothetical protein